MTERNDDGRSANNFGETKRVKTVEQTKIKKQISIFHVFLNNVASLGANLTTKKTTAFIALAVLTPQFSQAQSASTRLPSISGPISSSLGGAGVVSTEQSEAGFVNPASLAMAKAQAFSVIHQDGHIYQNTEQEFTGVTIVDPMTTPSTPTSISYVQGKNKFASADEFEFVYANLSFARTLADNMSIGFSVLYSSIPYENEDYVEWNGTVGFLYRPVNNFLLGLKYTHLVPPNDIPQEIKLPAELAVGGEYDMRGLLKIRGEVSRFEDLNPDKKWVLKTGFQAPIGTFFMYRMGYRFDQVIDEGALTVGLAFIGPQFKIDYSFQEHQVKDGKTVHSIDLRWPF